jgi:hypothetical protein
MFEANRKIGDLTPQMAERVTAWLSDCKKNGVAVLVTETRRTKARQFWLYSKGRVVTKSQEIGFLGYDDPAIDSMPKEKQVTWTLKSNHLIGEAVDFCFLTPAGAATYVGDWSKAYDLAERNGLKSLFRATGVDRPHLELNRAFVKLSDVDHAVLDALEKEFAQRSANAQGALRQLNEIKEQLAKAKKVPFAPYKITL